MRFHPSAHDRPAGRVRGLLHRGRRFGARVFVAPLQAFVATEVAGGIVLLAATAAALAWANSPWKDAYHDLWAARFALDLNLLAVRLDLLHVVNDGLMTVFFFVAGLEIKRELLRGELSSRRQAALPIAAALGGMIVPALIFAAWNHGGDGARGWGIPMATDIAFSLGALALLGSRAPFAVKAFLLALAIADDLGAIAVIAIFYSDGLDPVALAWAAGALAVAAAMGFVGVRSITAYVIVGAITWLAVFESGIHATVAGVALAALTPLRPNYDPAAFEETAGILGTRLQQALAAGDAEAAGAATHELEAAARDTISPLDRLEGALHPWVSFGIIPLFALANAGVAFSADNLRDAAGSTVTAGVAMGLLIGKPVGIILFSWLALRLGIGSLPSSLRFLHIVGAGLLAGVGFTVSIFVTGLAFDAAALQDEAKAGILAGSLLAGIAGFVYLWLAPGDENSRFTIHDSRF